MEGPLVLFGVVANPPTACILQLSQPTRPTMFCGVVRDLFGHGRGSSRLFAAKEVIEFGSDEDHIHFLVRYPPTVLLSSIIGTLKSKSTSAWLDKFGSSYGVVISALWTRGSFLCSAGRATLEIHRQYIENQGTR